LAPGGVLARLPHKFDFDPPAMGPLLGLMAGTLLSIANTYEKVADLMEGTN